MNIVSVSKYSLYGLHHDAHTTVSIYDMFSFRMCVNAEVIACVHCC